MPTRLIATNVTRQVVLADRGRVADSAWSRIVGLLRDTGLEAGDALWIVPCNSIHSFAMKFVFDALFLDRDFKVVHLVREMKPWRISAIKFAAHGVLELPAGAIAGSGTELGDQLDLRMES